MKMELGKPTGESNIPVLMRAIPNNGMATVNCLLSIRLFMDQH